MLENLIQAVGILGIVFCLYMWAWYTRNDWRKLNQQAEENFLEEKSESKTLETANTN